MNVGDTLRLRNVRNYGDDGKSWVETVAPKDEVLICVVLGTEPKKITDASQCLDTRAVMDEMGWQPKPVQSGEEPPVIQEPSKEKKRRRGKTS